MAKYFVELLPEKIQKLINVPIALGTIVGKSQLLVPLAWYDKIELSSDK